MTIIPDPHSFRGGKDEPTIYFSIKATQKFDLTDNLARRCCKSSMFANLGDPRLGGKVGIKLLCNLLKNKME